MVRGAGYAGVGVVLSQGLTLATYIVLARLVTPTELGQFAAGSILIGIGILFSESGMMAAVIHRQDRLDEAAATAVIATITAGLGFGLLGLAASPLIGLYFDSHTIGLIAAAMAGVLFLDSLGIIPNALLQRRFSFRRRMIIEPATALIFGVTAITATAWGAGVWGLVLGRYVAMIGDVGLTWGLVNWRPELRLASFAMWRELVGYGRHVLAAGLLRRVGEQFPTALAGRFIGAGALGQFQYASRITATPYSMLLNVASYVLFPAFARISADPVRFQPAFLRSIRWMAIIAMPIGFILIPLAEPLAILVFGPRWAEAGRTVTVLAVFIPARALASVVGEALRGSGHPRDWTVVNVAGVLVGVVVMASLLPAFGLIGIAVGVAVDSIVMAGYAMVRARRTLGVTVREIIALIVPPFGAAVFMSAVIFGVENVWLDAAAHGTVAGLLILFSEMILGLGVYAAALRIVDPAAVREVPSLVCGALPSGRGPVDRSSKGSQ